MGRVGIGVVVAHSMEEAVACALVVNGGDMVLVVVFHEREVNGLVGVCALAVNGDDEVLEATVHGEEAALNS